MSNKYSPRSLPSVYKAEDAPTSSSSWYNDFVGNLEKSSVQSQHSIYDEINAIIGNTKSKYSSVEEAVQDMRERTGLNAVLTAKQALAAIQEPEIFKQIPEMKTFIDNFVDDRPGTSVESVIHDLMKIDTIRDRLPDRADVENDVRIYINRRLGDIKSQHTDLNKVDMHIGKVDDSTPSTGDDPLAILEPFKAD
jgi:hypothetical protein